jgi:phosphohistidine phosphatase
MPRLMLLRHAQAVPSGKDGPRDHDRPLSADGRLECANLENQVKGRGGQLDLVLCSTSTRTRETWDGVRAAFSEEPEVRYLASIFETDGDYLAILRQEGGEARSLLLVGHNPAIHATARTLADDLDHGPAARLAGQFPTGALGIFDFDGSWAHLRGGLAHPIALLVPTVAST